MEEEKNEASQLIKQLDALNALRIKVKKPHFNGSTAENDNSFGGSEHCHSGIYKHRPTRIFIHDSRR